MEVEAVNVIEFPRTVDVGAERLIVTLNQNPDAAPEELIRNVYKAVDIFDENTPQFDDITMLCFKYYGTADRTEDK